MLLLCLLLMWINLSMGSEKLDWIFSIFMKTLLYSSISGSDVESAEICTRVYGRQSTDLYRHTTKCEKRLKLGK